MDDGVDPSHRRRALHWRVREGKRGAHGSQPAEPPLASTCWVASPRREGELSPLEQAGSVGRGPASCSRLRGDGGGLYPIPPLQGEPSGRGGWVRQRGGSRCAKIGVSNEAVTAAVSLEVHRDILENLLFKCRRRYGRVAWLWRRGGAQARTLLARRKQPSRRCSEGCWSVEMTVPATHRCPSMVTLCRSLRIWTTRRIFWRCFRK